jgi:hypothetical protein
MPDLHALRIPLPPLDVQQRITDEARQIGEATWPLLDELDAFKKRLAEYRAALTSEALVGDLDLAEMRAVRGQQGRVASDERHEVFA